MKIIVDYDNVEGKALNIAAAKYLGDFVIEINFSDNTIKIVDFKPFLSKSNHPSVKKYFDEKKFLQYKIINGNLNWNDYDMIFPISDLYKGKI